MKPSNLGSLIKNLGPTRFTRYLVFKDQEPLTLFILYYETLGLSRSKEKISAGQQLAFIQRRMSLCQEKKSEKIGILEQWNNDYFRF